ncbi:PQQ-dependent sugar dehydrogenase [Neolewinella sp.]|uniref:PQQ-dependent sugar dehydrogenase n=1 Tax=Neolewinella sp. TaxID=2993543 RepID=UPI003B52F09D
MRLLLTLLPFTLCTLAFAQPQATLQPLAESFDQPTDIVAAPRTESMLYIVEKEGRVQAVDTAAAAKTLWLDLSGEVDDRSEGGLLGMAFHPEPDSAYVYLNYTVPSPTSSNLLTTIVRLSLGDDGTPDVASRRIILTMEQPANNHNAGDLAFGPDGYLYIPTGDGGGGGDPYDNGQDPQSLLGKLLRIDVNTPTDANTPPGVLDYAIPPDNPFADSADTLAEIWSLGLRNPWRISFDRATGDLWIGDVGQNEREEVDLQLAGSAGGQNYGWNCREGFAAFANSSERFCGNGDQAFTAPELDYPHGGGGQLNGRSVTGGFVYRGPSANLQGYYIFGDFAARRLFFYRADLPEGERFTVRTDIPLSSISTFGEGSDGSLFVADFEEGTVYRIVGEGTTATRGQRTTVQLAVYPNPATDELRFELPPAFGAEVQIELRNMEGRTVLDRQLTATNNRATLSLPELVPGLYTLSLTDGERLAVGRVVIRR